MIFYFVQYVFKAETRYCKKRNGTVRILHLFSEGNTLRIFLEEEVNNILQRTMEWTSWHAVRRSLNLLLTNTTFVEHLFSYNAFEVSHVLTWTRNRKVMEIASTVMFIPFSYGLTGAFSTCNVGGNVCNCFKYGKYSYLSLFIIK